MENSKDEGTKLMEEAAFLANLPKVNFNRIIKILEQAAIKFRIDKEYFGAGNAFETIANTYETMDNNYQAANNYKKAGEMYMNCSNDYDLAKKSFVKSSKLFLKEGKFQLMFH
jgi:hypothetical protein